ELVSSKQTLEQQLNAEVTAFSYPYAFPQHRRQFKSQFRGLLAASGYRSSVTTTIGSVDAQDDALSLKRLPVNSCDDPDLLHAKVRGYYNWMAAAQSAAKRFAIVRHASSASLARLHQARKF